MASCFAAREDDREPDEVLLEDSPVSQNTYVGLTRLFWLFPFLYLWGTWLRSLRVHRLCSERFWDGSA